MKKTRLQLQKLSKHAGNIAGATVAKIDAADILEDLEGSENCGSGLSSNYSVQFIQHAKQTTTDAKLTGACQLYPPLRPDSGFAIKANEGKRTVFTLEQKEILILFMTDKHRQV